MFDIPTTKEEMNSLGIKQLDVILISGDSFVDHPSFGVAIIARVLKDICGLKVGVISQPDWKSEKDIKKLGEPKYFFGVSGGNLDSMVSNYTASRKKRKTDFYSPNTEFGKRPDRASIVYSNLIKQYFNKPIILGGIEASLRRMAHYDWWQNKVKNSILLDSKADLIVYGMGEKTIIEIGNIFKNGGTIEDCKSLRGIVYWKSEMPNNYNFINIPSLEEVKKDKQKYFLAFKTFQKETDPLNAKGIIQKHFNRYVIQNPPQYCLTTQEMDEVYSLKYTRQVAPSELKKGYVKSFDTVKNSITSHRGCYGECNFCALTLHQGRTIQSRSPESIIKEAEIISSQKNFNGIISDVGGPTANMYGYDCKKKIELGACKEKSCIGYEFCNSLSPDHSKYIELLNSVEKVKGVKKVFISSGIRVDLIYKDKKYGMKFLKNLIKKHIPGRFKIAPEHADDEVLKLMNKPSFDLTEKFINDLRNEGKKLNLNTKFSAYLIAAHPGSNKEMEENSKNRIKNSFGFVPNDVQIFTPTPSTNSTTMYYTNLNLEGKKIYIEKDEKTRVKFKDVYTNNDFNKKKTKNVNKRKK
jgi:uncharacterized radical SAM protein YgiQ